VSLHCEVTGQGKPLVLLHGWGLHGGIFSALATALAERFRVYVPDLPGFGRSARVQAGTLTEYRNAVTEVVPPDAAWLGWSFGALIALEAASAGQVRKLMLTGATPYFAARDDWPHGISSATLATFANDLQRDWRGTLDRFLALNIGDEPQARRVLRELQAKLYEHGEPDVAALRNGMTILAGCDLRASLSGITTPTLIIQGTRDRLTHPDAARYIARAMPNATLTLWPQAAHAPFLSAPEAFATAIAEFAA
jgi:pimeloyl-[acyl-carrier protein] methyl ester esterase